jgi:predicted alpha/beta-fold hydrolase
MVFIHIVKEYYKDEPSHTNLLEIKTPILIVNDYEKLDNNVW